MKKIILLPIILGSILLIGGGIVFGMAIANKTNDVITNTYDLTDTYNDFDIKLSTSSLKFEPSTDGTTKVVCVERKKEYHDVSVIDNKLSIQFHNDLKWYERIFIFDWQPRKVTVYLPAKAYGDLNVKSSTGSITIPSDFSFNSLNAKLHTGSLNFNCNVTTLTKAEASTGSIRLNNMTTSELNVKVSTGSIVMKNVEVTTDATFKASTGSTVLENFKAENVTATSSTGGVRLTDTLINTHVQIKCDTGSVKLERSDAETLDIETDTGSINVNLLTTKIFDAKSGTGSVNVPNASTWSGGVCRLKTNTGSIKATVGA